MDYSLLLSSLQTTSFERGTDLHIKSGNVSQDLLECLSSLGQIYLTDFHIDFNGERIWQGPEGCLFFLKDPSFPLDTLSCQLRWDLDYGAFPFLCGVFSLSLRCLSVSLKWRWHLHKDCITFPACYCGDLSRGLGKSKETLTAPGYAHCSEPSQGMHLNAAGKMTLLTETDIIKAHWNSREISGW